MMYLHLICIYLYLLISINKLSMYAILTYLCITNRSIYIYTHAIHILHAYIILCTFRKTEYFPMTFSHILHLFISHFPMTSSWFLIPSIPQLRVHPPLIFFILTPVLVSSIPINWLKILFYFPGSKVTPVYICIPKDSQILCKNKSDINHLSFWVWISVILSTFIHLPTDLMNSNFIVAE